MLRNIAIVLNEIKKEESTEEIKGNIYNLVNELQREKKFYTI